mgnify:CR=1 FL=1
MRRLISLFILLLAAAGASAIDTERAFDDPELQARYEKIIDEVRCLKCQNQSIKDSNVMLASDLRREIRRMIGDGMSDEEIFDFLVTRYGEFALYRPRASGKTLVLWIVPGALVVAGLFLVGMILRKRMTMPIDADPDEG